MFITLFIYFYVAIIIYIIYATINRQNKKAHIVKKYQEKRTLLAAKGYTVEDIQKYAKLYYQIYSKELNC